MGEDIRTAAGRFWLKHSSDPEFPKLVRLEKIVEHRQECFFFLIAKAKEEGLHELAACLEAERAAEVR